MRIEQLAEAVRANRVRVTNHADEEAAADSLLLDEILASTIAGATIEEYPDDTPYPSCLVYGRTPTNEPVHSVWALNDANG